MEPNTELGEGRSGQRDLVLAQGNGDWTLSAKTTGQ